MGETDGKIQLLVSLYLGDASRNVAYLGVASGTIGIVVSLALTILDIGNLTLFGIWLVFGAQEYDPAQGFDEGIVLS